MILAFINVAFFCWFAFLHVLTYFLLSILSGFVFMPLELAFVSEILSNILTFLVFASLVIVTFKGFRWQLDLQSSNFCIRGLLCWPLELSLHMKISSYTQYLGGLHSLSLLLVLCLLCVTSNWVFMAFYSNLAGSRAFSFSHLQTLKIRNAWHLILVNRTSDFQKIFKSSAVPKQD